MIVQNMAALLPMLDAGKFLERLNADLDRAMTHLTSKSLEQPKKEFKGKLTLSLDIRVKDGGAWFDATVELKLPKEVPSSTFLFLTKEGRLSTEHPTQADLFKPRIAETG